MQNIKKLLKTNKSGLVSGYCSAPWSEITIDDNGYIFACSCNGYVKKPIFNILEVNSKEEFKKLLQNNIMKDSILNGSYSLCNGIVCPNIQDNILLKKQTIFFKNSKEELDSIILKNILMQVDESCNLQCPTCRNNIIMHKNNQKTTKLKKILDKIEEYIFNNYKQNLYFRIVGNGELFSSNVMLPWFLNFDFEKYSNINFDLHTNATLISRYEDFLLKNVKRLRIIEVSTDAGTPETYEIVRKNGKWENFIKGLDTVKKLKNTNNEISFNNSFVISSLNYKDIPYFLQLVKKYDSNPIFYKVLRWTMDEEKFNSLNIFSPKHQNHNDFLKLLEDINLKNYASSIFNIKLNN